MEGLQNENSTKTRSVFIAALVFCVHLVEQLTSDRKGHDDRACMSISDAIVVKKAEEKAFADLFKMIKSGAGEHRLIR